MRGGKIQEVWREGPWSFHRFKDPSQPILRLKPHKIVHLDGDVIVLTKQVEHTTSAGIFELQLPMNMRIPQMWHCHTHSWRPHSHSDQSHSHPTPPHSHSGRPRLHSDQPHSHWPHHTYGHPHHSPQTFLHTWSWWTSWKLTSEHYVGIRYGHHYITNGL